MNDKTARVVLAVDRTKPAPLPSLPARYEVRQYVALQLPKVDAVTLIEEKPIP